MSFKLWLLSLIISAIAPIISKNLNRENNPPTTSNEPRPPIEPGSPFSGIS